MTLHFFVFLRPVITILHFELAGGKGWSFPWGGLRLKHPSTPVHLWIRGAQSQYYVLSVHCVCVCVCVCVRARAHLSLLFHCHFHGDMSSLSSVLLLSEGISVISCTQNATARDLCNSNCLQGSNAYSKLLLVLYTM